MAKDLSFVDAAPILCVGVTTDKGLKETTVAFKQAFAVEGKVKATIETLALECINDVFERLRTGRVNGRVVLGIQ